MNKLYVELNGGQSFRPAANKEVLRSNTTKSDLKSIDEQIESLKRRRETLQKTCDHKVFYDIEGWPYDLRTCNGCGASLGAI